MTKYVLTRSLFALWLVVIMSSLSFASSDLARGSELSDACADCHGDNGLGDDETPAIAGMHTKDLITALEDFKSGARVDEYEIMTEIASDLDDQDILDLAAYFSSLKAK